MSKRQFHIKINLEVQAITCPGVWLCPNGDVELSIMTLGYNFKAELKPARFPLCYHENFLMEGFFRSVDSLIELERQLGNEKVEISLWQNGRRLAHFTGKFNVLLHPYLCAQKSLENDGDESRVDVEIVMKPSTSFPGILAPKINLTSHVYITEVCTKCNTYLQRINIPIWTVNQEHHRHQHHIHKDPNEFKRQKAVCHSHKNNRSTRYPHDFQSIRDLYPDDDEIIDFDETAQCFHHHSKTSREEQPRQMSRKQHNNNLVNEIKPNANSSRRHIVKTSINDENNYSNKHLKHDCFNHNVNDSCEICKKYKNCFKL